MTDRVDISVIPTENRDESNCECEFAFPHIEVSDIGATERIPLVKAYDNKDVIMQIALLKCQKQNKLTAGDNVTIENDVISVTIPPIPETAQWGNISGDISDQADLQEALAEKQDAGDYATEEELSALEEVIETKQDIIDSDNKLSAEYIQGLANVALTNSYGSLGHLPTINGHTLHSSENYEDNTLDYLGVQAKLVSGTTIKTLGGNSLLGSGNITFPTVTYVGYTP